MAEERCLRTRKRDFKTRKIQQIATKYIFLTMSVFLLALRFEVC